MLFYELTNMCPESAMGVGSVQGLLWGRAVSGISYGGGLCQGSPMGVSCVRDLCVRCLLWGVGCARHGDDSPPHPCSVSLRSG